MLTQDLKIYRGDKTVITILVKGDYTNRNACFVVKADKEITSDRLIEKTSERSEIVITLVGAKTQYQVTVNPVDTYDLTATKYYWDLQCNLPGDETDLVTVVKGNLNLTGDVQTPFDGYPLPQGDEFRYEILSADDGEIGDIIFVTEDEGNNKVLDFTSLHSLYSLSIKADDGEVGDMVQIKLNDGELAFDFVSLLNLKQQLDAL